MFSIILRSTSARLAPLARPTFTRITPITTLHHVNPPIFTQRRFYAQHALSENEIKERVLNVIKGFDKVDPKKVTPTSSFSTELGLDSLDAVEIVMAIEEEFSIEIPDADADKIKSTEDAIEYIKKIPQAK